MQTRLKRIHKLSLADVYEVYLSSWNSRQAIGASISLQTHLSFSPRISINPRLAIFPLSDKKQYKVHIVMSPDPSLFQAKQMISTKASLSTLSQFS